MDDLYIAAALFAMIVVSAILLKAIGHALAPAPKRGQVQVPPGCVAVVLTPDQLSEIAHGLDERREHLQRMDAARPSRYFQSQIEHLQGAIDAIAVARAKAD